MSAIEAARAWLGGLALIAVFAAAIAVLSLLWPSWPEDIGGED